MIGMPQRRPSTHLEVSHDVIGRTEEMSQSTKQTKRPNLPFWNLVVICFHSPLSDSFLGATVCARDENFKWLLRGKR